MLTSNGKLSVKALTKQEEMNLVTLQRECGRSSFAIGTDDNSPALLGPSPGLPHASHYLFNSTPCAYTWFHH
jgi:hypothetical protein